MSGDGEANNSVGREKRSEPREPVYTAARLMLERGVMVDAMIVDRSLKGLRLRLAQGTTVASTLTVLDLTRAVIHQVKVVWKAYPDIGVQMQSSFDVRTGDGPEATTMRRLWFEATSSRLSDW